MSYDEFLAMPVTNRHVEVVDGVIFVMPGVSIRHQRILGRIERILGLHVEAKRLGLVVQAPADVVIRTRPKLRLRQPDLMFFSNDKPGFVVADHDERIQTEPICPDLVEVLSPGQNERTLADKLADYATIGVEEVWCADQATTSIRVLSLDGSAYRLSGEYRPVSAVLPVIDLDVSAMLVF